MSNSNFLHNPPQKDVYGTELQPYCRVVGIPKNTEFHIKTSDLIEHIEKSEEPGAIPWDWRLEDLRSKEVSIEGVRDHSKNSPGISDERIDIGGKFENVSENLIYSGRGDSNSSDQGICISFIPPSNNVATKLIIGTHLDLVKVTQGDKIRHYPRDDIIKAMNQGKWRIVQDNQGEKYEPPKTSEKDKTSADRMENLLLGLDPVTIRPNGKKKDIYLEDHLDSANTKYLGGPGGQNHQVEINITKNRVTGNLAYSGEKLKSKSKSEPEKQSVGMER